MPQFSSTADVLSSPVQNASVSSSEPSTPAAPPSSRFSRKWIALLVVVLIVALVAPNVYQHLRATAVLMVIAEKYNSPLVRFDQNPVREELIDFPISPSGTAKARIYHPVGVAHPSPVVVIHGVHHLGIEEPRLMRFSRALASHGYLVLTPQVDELADYNVEPHSAVVIGDAVRELSRRTGSQKVGVLGLSFAGGMSLIAAADPQVQQHLSGVIAIGPHDDLARVLNYYQTNQAPTPDGKIFTQKAHEYGSLVVAYSHASIFFSPQDVAQARRTLRLLLWENLPASHEAATHLSPAGQARMKQLYAHDTMSLVPDTRRALATYRDELAASSPHNYVGRVHVPVLLLHGAGDTVVPPSETLWLERELPHDALRAALVTPMIGHVEIGQYTFVDELRLVHWMKLMLDQLDTAHAKQN